LLNHLIIDTDIGTDVDDAIALLQILGSGPEDNLSITTVYGDVKRRAQIASNYCRLMDKSIDIYPGENHTISGRDIWTSGLEGSLHEELNMQIFNDESGVKHIARSVSEDAQTVEIIAIAPLTNLAKSMRLMSGKMINLKQIYMMGGRFSPGKMEHNVVCDIKAAQHVFDSKFRIDVVGIEITTQLRLSLLELNYLSGLSPAASLLHKEINQWAQFLNHDWIVPHDSIAFLMRSKPELFEFSGLGDIRVFEDGKTEFHENPFGTKRIVMKMDVEGARSSIISSLEGVKFSS
jgi:purine nucleosidase